MKTTIKLVHADQLGKTYTENILANSAVVNTSMDSDTALAVDSFCRALVALTTDIYKSVSFQENKELEEWMEE